MNRAAQAGESFSGRLPYDCARCVDVEGALALTALLILAALIGEADAVVADAETLFPFLGL